MVLNYYYCATATPITTNTTTTTTNIINMTASVVYWSEFLDIYTEILGSIPGATKFSDK
jgi:hypothetical protein